MDEDLSGRKFVRIPTRYQNHKKGLIRVLSAAKLSAVCHAVTRLPAYRTIFKILAQNKYTMCLVGRRAAAGG